MILLVGSYDGSGNYGDVAQLQATINMLERLGDGVAVLPMVDLRYVESHRGQELAATASFDPERMLYFAVPSGEADLAASAEGLVPATLPPDVEYAATYLYGGGYLNARWAARMLIMAQAADALSEKGGVPVRDRLSSGIQIEPAWARGLDGPYRRLLRELPEVGVRDQLSAEAAAALAGRTATRPLADRRRRGRGDRPRHPARLGPRLARRRAGDQPAHLPRCLGDRRSGRPATRSSAASWSGLAEAAGKTLDVQPLIAYEDPPDQRASRHRPRSRGRGRRRDAVRFAPDRSCSRVRRASPSARAGAAAPDGEPAPITWR